MHFFKIALSWVKKSNIVLALGLFMGSAGAGVEPTPAVSRSASLVYESADLAEAVSASRSLSLGETLSPAERTLKLATAATAKKKLDDSKKESKDTTTKP